MAYKLSQNDYNGLKNEIQVGSINCDETYYVFIYPNPIEDIMIISSKINGVVTLFDVTGKILFQQMIEAGENKFSMLFITSGVYIANIELSNGKIENQKLIKL